MDLQATLTALVERVAKLESAKARRRVYNQQEAARELGMSVNKFRQEQKAGRVRGTLMGAFGPSPTQNFSDAPKAAATEMRVFTTIAKMNGPTQGLSRVGPRASQYRGANSDAPFNTRQ